MADNARCAVLRMAGNAALDKERTFAETLKTEMQVRDVRYLHRLCCSATGLRACYAVSGTGIAYAALLPASAWY
eukprot:888438-Rhodomonas_salina.1